MSGFCLIVDFSGAPVSAPDLEAMIAAGRHRGPQGVRRHLAGNVAAAHLALWATPESEREVQPQVVADGQVLAVGDLRLDGRRELAARLDLAGEDATDAGLLSAAYLLWGVDCPRYLLGDFAFAIWDRRSQRLFCARDGFGVRPLHFWRKGELLYVASEAQQLLAVPGVPRHVDEATLAAFLLNRNPEPGRTAYRDLCSLPARRSLSADRQSQWFSESWVPAARPAARREAPPEIADQLRDCLALAVSDRLRASGSTIGLMLSGGMDSPTVAAFAAATLADGTRNQGLTAYSYRFSKLVACDESRYVAELRDRLGFELEWIDAEDLPLGGGDAGLEPELESPFIGWKSTDRRIFSRLEGAGGRVLLTGYGGDNLFQGTSLVFLSELLRGRLEAISWLFTHAERRGVGKTRALYRFLLAPSLPAAVDLGLRRLLGRTDESDCPPWLNTRFLARHAAPILSKTRRGRPRSLAAETLEMGLRDFSAVERTCSWRDRLGAGYGVETRHPFLDRRLVDLVSGLPPELFFKGEKRKRILRQAMSGALPASVLEREDKTNFVPFIDWSVRAMLGGQAKQPGEFAALAERGVVNLRDLAPRVRRFREGSENGFGVPLWFLLSAEAWLRRLEAGERSVQVLPFLDRVSP